MKVRPYIEVAGVFFLSLALGMTADGQDFNGDGVLDGDDINLLTRAVAGGATMPDFDLNGDGSVDRDDVSRWLGFAGHVNLGHRYPHGDGDLNGVTDAADFFAWNANKVTENTEWTGGNYFVDHVTDYFDLGVWVRGESYIPPADLPRADDLVRMYYNHDSEQLMVRTWLPLEVISVPGARPDELPDFGMNILPYFGDQQQWFTAPTEPSLLRTAEIAEYPEGTGLDELGPALILSDVVYEVPVRPALPGDANLDNRVDAEDFIIWNENRFKERRDWTQGDFNGDERTDAEDFIIWNENKFTIGVEPPMTVPEPSTCCLLLMGCLTFWRRR